MIGEMRNGNQYVDGCVWENIYLVPGDEERVHVADGSAGGEDAVAASESYYLPHLGQHLQRQRERDVISI